MLIDIFRYSIGNIFWGILLSAFCMFLLFFLIRGFYPKYIFNIKSYIIGAILFVVLAFQSVLFTGALTIKKKSNEVGNYINDYVTAYYPTNAQISVEDSQILFDEILKDYPLIRRYVDKGTFTGFNPSNIAEAVVNTINNHFNWYMLRRIMWSLLFVCVSVFIAILTADVKRQTGRPTKRQHRQTVKARYDNNF